MARKSIVVVRPVRGVNYDQGTSSPAFQVDSANSGPKFVNNAGTMVVRNSTETADAPIKASEVKTDTIKTSSGGGNITVPAATGTMLLDTTLERAVEVLCIGYGTACTIQDGVGYFRVPIELNGYNLNSVGAAVITAGTTGSMSIQVHNKTDAVDMLSTKLTIDSEETDSKTAATPAVINTSYDDVVTGDLLRIDIDTIHSTPASGLLVCLGFKKG
jgi:hypothetical protein